MPPPSSDGRYGGSELTIEIPEATEDGAVEDGAHQRWRVTDLAFFAFFAVFFGSVVAVVLLGLGSVIASTSETLHETFHVRALGAGPLAARIYARMADAAHAVSTGPGTWLGFAFSLFNMALAVFLLWLRPRDRTARLLSVGMVGTAAVFNLSAQTTIEIQPLLLDESFGHISAHMLTGGAYMFALLLFPDGRLVPRWRAPALVVLYLPVGAAVVLLAWLVEGTARPGVLLLFFGLVVPVAGVAGQAYRFRRSDDPAEHQQARLLFWALIPALGFGMWYLASQGLPSLDVGLAGRHLPEQPIAVFRIFQPVFLLVPLALFLGLLRFRLWDIDRVVNRTLVYGLVTGVLLAAYLGIVVLLQRVLGPFTAGNDIAVASSTLAVAAAFVPVRRRIQDFVDRRFYRHRYDVQQTVEAFTSRLRDEVDLETLSFELRGVVARTMQPRELSLLIRNPEGQLEWQWTYRGRPGQRPAGSARNESGTPSGLTRGS